VEHYLNLNGDSGVTRYAIGRDFIRVQFRDPTIYVYDYVRPGKHHVDRMKELAVSGRGLGTYISQNVGKAYARKE
jgi:hypothetical protein